MSVQHRHTAQISGLERTELDFQLSLLRFTEKGNLEVLLFTIQSKMRANNQKVYMPREGKLISDINKVKIMFKASV